MSKNEQHDPDGTPSGEDVGRIREKAISFDETPEENGSTSEAGASAAAATAYDGASPSGKRKGAPAWLAVASVVILVAGLAAVIWQGTEYYHARQDQKLSESRDEVLDVASQVVINSMSFSKDTVDDDMARLREDSTGAFLSQQDEYADQIKQTITDQGATTRAEVSNSAVSAIDLDLGTATVVMVYTATSERKDLPGVSGRQAARVELQREDDRWKVSDLVPVGSQVPVGDSSQSVQDLGGADPSATPSSGAAAPSSSASPSGSAKPTSSAPATTTTSGGK